MANDIWGENCRRVRVLVRQMLVQRVETGRISRWPEEVWEAEGISSIKWGEREIEFSSVREGVA
jgi:hypothetical protein